MLAIPAKRYDRTLVCFLSPAEVDALLAAPDRSTWLGRRDHALLAAARPLHKSPTTERFRVNAVREDSQATARAVLCPPTCAFVPACHGLCQALPGRSLRICSVMTTLQPITIGGGSRFRHISLRGAPSAKISGS